VYKIKALTKDLHYKHSRQLHLLRQMIGAFAPKEPVHSSINFLFGLFAAQGLGMNLVLATPFGGTKLAPTSE